MQIVEVSRFGETAELHVVEKAMPSPQAGQILVEVKASGINYADILACQGHYPEVKTVPYCPGFEVAGVVARCGEGVQGFAPGDRVMGLLSAGTGGGYATHALVDVEKAYPLPSQIDFAPATALLAQGLTAYFLLKTAWLRAGENVLVSAAAGGVGTLAVQLAKLLGAGQVVGLASRSKHALVESLGADATVDYAKDGWADAVRAATVPTGIDVFLDSQGNLDGEGFETLNEGARWLVYGLQSGKGGSLTPGRLGTMLFRNLTLRGYLRYQDEAAYGLALREMTGWVVENKLQIHVSRFPLVEAAKAHEEISARRTVGKVVLEASL